MLPVHRAMQQMAVRFDVAPAIRRVMDQFIEPFASLGKRISEWINSIVAPMRQMVKDVIRSPLMRGASELLNKQALGLKKLHGPAGLLIQTHQRRMAEAFKAPIQDLDPVAAPPADKQIVLPDEATLTAFFVEERGDNKWRKGAVGWLLRAVPLSVGAHIHERFLDSSVVALEWLAERLVSRELRRMLVPALGSANCDVTTKAVLLAGVDHYMSREWEAADTLLTAGLDGLVLDLAVQRGVITEGHKVKKPNGKSGRGISTGGDTLVLARLGLDASQISYLTTLSLGQTGNPPRHGAASPLGSDVHAAGSLLGVILILHWLDEKSDLVARALGAGRADR